MLHVQNKTGIENFRFQRCVLLVRTKHGKNVFGRGQRRNRFVDIQTLIVVIVIVSLIAVDCQHGEDRDQVCALAENIRQ